MVYTWNAHPSDKLAAAAVQLNQAEWAQRKLAVDHGKRCSSLQKASQSLLLVLTGPRQQGLLSCRQEHAVHVPRSKQLCAHETSTANNLTATSVEGVSCQQARLRYRAKQLVFPCPCRFKRAASMHTHKVRNPVVPTDSTGRELANSAEHDQRNTNTSPIYSDARDYSASSGLSMHGAH